MAGRRAALGRKLAVSPANGISCVLAGRARAGKVGDTDPLCLEAEAAIWTNAVAIDKGNVGVPTAHHQRIFAVDQPVVKAVEPASVEHRPSCTEWRNHNGRAPVPVQEPELRS